MKRRLTLFAPALALLLTACAGSAGESSPAGTPAGSLSPVYADWSKLEPDTPEKVPHTRWHDAPVDRLLPVQGGYGGPLIPFVGALREGTWVEICKYGLATADGAVVCDPVYSEVRREGDYLILSRVGTGERYDAEQDWDINTVSTAAAADGRWVLPEEYKEISPMSDGRLLLVDTGGGVWLCDRAGAVTPSPLTETLRAYPEIMLTPAEFRSSFQDGTAIYQKTLEEGGSWLLNALTGQVRSLPQVGDCWGWPSGDPLAAAQSVDEAWGYLDRNGDWAIPPQFGWAGAFEGDCAMVERAGGGYALIDRTGRTVVENTPWLNSCQSAAGERFYLELEWNGGTQTVGAVYDSDGRPLADHPLRGREVEYVSGGVATREGGVMTFWDYDGTVLGTAEGCEGLRLSGFENGRAEVYEEKSRTCGLYDLKAGAWVVPVGKYAWMRSLTDGERTIWMLCSADEVTYDVADETGAVIARVETVDDFFAGLICVRNGGYSGFLDLQGNWVFRWPIENNSD